MTRPLWHPRTEKQIAALRGKLPQGLVVDGPSGIGVVETARHLAQSMGATPFLIEPKRTVNGQMVVDGAEGNVIIEDIRKLYEQTRTRQPNTQVYVIDTGERSMTVAAQNAFLKLLEEPRQGLYFIIATHYADQLLPTIMSRSQRLQLLPVTTEQTERHIRDLGVNDPTKAARLAFVGRGLPGLLTRLSSDEKAYEKRVALMVDARGMLAGSAYERMTTAHKYKDNRGDAVTLIDDINHQLKTIVRSKPDAKLVKNIHHNLDARRRILAGGNIRLQLARAVLQW